MFKNTTIVFMFHRHKLLILFCVILWEINLSQILCKHKRREYYIPEGPVRMLHTDQVFLPS
jgi:hypothetical protein